MKTYRTARPCRVMAIAVGLLSTTSWVLGQADNQNLPETFGVGGPEFNAALDAKPLPDLPSVKRQLQLNQVEEMRLGDIDVAAAEARMPICEGKCRRVGVGRPVNVSVEQGQWRNVGDGDLWVMDVVSDGAMAVRLHITHMGLPEGAQLHFYAPDRPDAMEGPYETFGPLNNTEFWTGVFEGDRVRIEYFAPQGKPVAPANLRPFIIDQAQHIYVDLMEEGGIAGAGCHNDVTCYGAPWSTVKESVARILYVDGGSFVCTGQLLNSLAGDLTPYFLTANHCVDTNTVANTVQFFWRYQTASCNGAVPSLSDVPKSNIGTLLSTSSASDYSLLMVEGALPCGMWWNGWTPNVIGAGTTTACIHHPGGTFKRISFGTKATAAAACSSGDPNFLRINWTDGPTEPGSSGSAVYTTGSQQVIGQLFCGPSACGSVTYDHFGAFRETYNDNVAVQNFLDGGSDDASEPNDSCAGAVLVTEGTYSGRIVKGNDDDWYRITIPAGGQLSVSLSFTHANGDVDTQLYGVCGGSALDSSTGTGNSEFLSYVNPGGAATFYIHVYLFGCDTRATYSMTVSASLSNDNCTSPTVISDIALNYNPSVYNTALSGTSILDPLESCEFNNVGVSNSVFYSFTPCATGLIGVNTVGSAYDTVLSIFTGSCGSATQVACNDDIGGGDLDSQLLNVPVTANVTYTIKVSDYDTAQGGGNLDFNFQYLPNAPSNDSCATPIVISGATTTYNPLPYCTAGADTAGTEPQESCGSPPNSNTVFYTFTPNASGRASINTYGSDYDTVLSVFTGTCLTETQVACDDDTGGVQSELVKVPMSAGVLYRIKVAEYNLPGGGRLDFNLTFKRCLADIAPLPNGNNVVNVDDLLAVINGWGSCPLPCLSPCAADIAPLAGNCIVNVDDLLAVINGWGNCP